MTTPVPTSVPPAYSSSQRWRIVAVAGVVPLALAFTGSALMVSWLPELPDPIAIHWGAGGAPDGFGSVAAMIAMLIGIVAVFSAITVTSLRALRATTRGSAQPRFLAATSVWLAVFLSIALTGSVATQRGLPDAAEAGSVAAPFLVALAFAFLLGAAAFFLTPRPALLDPALEPGAAPALALTSEEKASWSRTVRPSATFLVIFGLVFGVGSAGMLLTAALTGAPGLWWLILPVAIVSSTAGVFFFWRVRVDYRGFAVRSGAGFPRTDIPLESIISARVIRVNPFAEFGGWGWRRDGSGRTGIVVRGGEAIEVTRTTGKALVVTVDDATTAVALLEGLLRRREGSGWIANTEPTSPTTLG